jgi:beta-lactam-binding protein with PASTA domain
MKAIALILLVAFGGSEPLAAVVSARTMSLAPAPQYVSRQCEIPDVTGLSRSEADVRLRQADLAVGQVSTQPADHPAGTVIGQEPRCGPRPRDGRVHLVVSSGSYAEPSRPVREGGGTSVGDVALPVGIVVGAAVIGAILSRRGQDQTTTVPDLVNLPESAVAATLEKARLRAGEAAKQESLTVAAGRVISQTPVAGTRVAPGSPVSVRISAGRALVEVPDLAGLDWQNANAQTTGARLRMLVTDPQASDFAGMTVASQMPAAGTRVLAGATVGVTLRGVEVPAVVPAVALPPAPPPQPLPPPDPPAAVQPEPAAPVRAAPVPAAPPPVAQVPAVAGEPAAPTAPQPDAVLAQVLPAPVVPAAPPLTPVTPPPDSTTWVWPLWVLLLLLVVPAGNHVRKRFATRSVPPAAGVVPPPPRVTVIPRLDAGRQAITSSSRDLRGHFDVVYHVNGGGQRAWFDDRAPRAGRVGAES